MPRTRRSKAPRCCKVHAYNRSNTGWLDVEDPRHEQGSLRERPARSLLSHLEGPLVVGLRMLGKAIPTLQQFGICCKLARCHGEMPGRNCHILIQGLLSADRENVSAQHADSAATVLAIAESLLLRTSILQENVKCPMKPQGLLFATEGDPMLWISVLIRKHEFQEESRTLAYTSMESLHLVGSQDHECEPVTLVCQQLLAQLQPREIYCPDLAAAARQLVAGMDFVTVEYTLPWGIKR